MTSGYLMRPTRTLKQARIDQVVKRARENPVPHVNVAAKALSDPRNRPQAVPSGKTYQRRPKHIKSGVES